jgi:hypothetical protein
MTDSFDANTQPMRALRDLIVMCESEGREGPLLDRARDAFTALRAIFGDVRPAEDIADEQAMIEPLTCCADRASMAAVHRTLAVS